MHADCGVAESCVGFGDFEGVFGFGEIGAGHHEFLTACIQRALDDVFEVVVMALLVVVDTPKDGVGEVDADVYISQLAVFFGHCDLTT